MALHYCIAPELILTVQEGFLTFCLKDEVVLSLDCRQVSKFTSKLFCCSLQAGFRVPLSDNAYLSQETLDFGDGKEKTFCKGDLDRFFQGLIACIPVLLLGQPDTQAYVAAVRKLTIFVAEKKTIEEGKLFWKNLKAGIHPSWLIEFCGTSNCETKKLLNYLFFHCTLIQSVWQLRNLLLKTPTLAADA